MPVPSADAPLDSAERAARRAELAFALLAAIVAGFSVWYGFDKNGARDWDFFESDLASARRAILEHHEWPAWMPYRAGGHDAWADPQSLWASPLGLLSLAFGPAVGIRLFVALCAGAAFLGAARLGARLGLALPGRAFFGMLLSVSAPLALYTAAGVPTFILGLAVLPWILWCFLGGTEFGFAAAGALLALDLYGGDVNHFLFHSLFLGLTAAALALWERKLLWVWGLAIATVTAGCLSAPKLVPMMLHAAERPRPTEGFSGDLTWGMLGRAFVNQKPYDHLTEPRGNFFTFDSDGNFVRIQDAVKVWPPSGELQYVVDWFNVGCYIGWIAAALAAAGIVAWAARGFRGRAAAVLFAGAFFLWLSLGLNVVPSAWELLHSLPVFSTMRSPGRLILYVFLCVALLAAIGFDALARFMLRTRGRAGAAIAIVVFAAVTGDAHLPARKAYKAAFVESREAAVPTQQFQQRIAPLPFDTTFYGPRVLPFVVAGSGAINGYAANRRAPAALSNEDPRYNGEAFAEGAGPLAPPRVATRRIFFTSQLREPQLVVLNHNYAPGWTVEAPAGQSCEASPDGRLAVRAPAGTTQFVLVYRSPGTLLGIAIAFLFVIFAYAAARLRKRVSAPSPSAAGSSPSSA